MTSPSGLSPVQFSAPLQKGLNALLSHAYSPKWKKLSTKWIFLHIYAFLSHFYHVFITFLSRFYRCCRILCIFFTLFFIFLLVTDHFWRYLEKRVKWQVFFCFMTFFITCASFLITITATLNKLIFLFWILTPLLSMCTSENPNHNATGRYQIHIHNGATYTVKHFNQWWNLQSP